MQTRKTKRKNGCFLLRVMVISFFFFLFIFTSQKSEAQKAGESPKSTLQTNSDGSQTTTDRYPRHTNQDGTSFDRTVRTTIDKKTGIVEKTESITNYDSRQIETQSISNTTKMKEDFYGARTKISEEKIIHINALDGWSIEQTITTDGKTVGSKMNFDNDKNLKSRIEFHADGSETYKFYDRDGNVTSTKEFAKSDKSKFDVKDAIPQEKPAKLAPEKSKNLNTSLLDKNSITDLNGKTSDRELVKVTVTKKDGSRTESKDYKNGVPQTITRYDRRGKVIPEDKSISLKDTDGKTVCVARIENTISEIKPKEGEPLRPISKNLILSKFDPLYFDPLVTISSGGTSVSIPCNKNEDGTYSPNVDIPKDAVCLLSVKGKDNQIPTIAGAIPLEPTQESSITLTTDNAVALNDGHGVSDGKDMGGNVAVSDTGNAVTLAANNNGEVVEVEPGTGEEGGALLVAADKTAHQAVNISTDMSGEEPPYLAFIRPTGFGGGSPPGGSTLKPEDFWKIDPKTGKLEPITPGAKATPEPFKPTFKGKPLKKEDLILEERWGMKEGSFSRGWAYDDDKKDWVPEEEEETAGILRGSVENGGQVGVAFAGSGGIYTGLDLATLLPGALIGGDVKTLCAGMANPDKECLEEEEKNKQNLQIGL